MAISERHTRLEGSERPRPASHTFVAPVDATEVITVALVIRPQPGSPPLPDLAHWQATPLGERRFLTPDEYARTHGAALSDLDAVAAFAASHGLAVVESHAGRRCVHLQGTAAQLNEAFGVTLKHYKGPLPVSAPRTRMGVHEEPAKRAVSTQNHHGYDGPVHLPAELAGIVTAVVGLDNRCGAGAAGGANDPPGANSLQVPAAAAFYNFPNSGATGMTIGVHAPQTTPGVGASYLPNDINNLYFPNLTNAAYRTAPASINDVNLTVGSNTYSNNQAAVKAITAATNLNIFPNNYIIEVTQDISTSATVAQGATVNVYFTQNSELGWLAFLNRVLLPQGESQPVVITSSFPLNLSDDTGTVGDSSSSGSVAGVMSALFQQLAAVGVNVFIALGDWGADDSLTDGKTHVSYPGSDPWVTSCGGTLLAGSAGPPVKLDERVWNDSWSTSGFGSNTADFGTTGGGASGGGLGANFPVPPYQTAAGITSITDSAGNTLKARFVPDVACMVAYQGFFVNGLTYSFTGTSCVAPLYAGLIAVLRNAFGVQLGFLNPTLYQLGKNTTLFPFNDITSGNNDSSEPAPTKDSPFFTAGAGWDPCTGWGSIDGLKLLNGIAGLMYSQTFYFGIGKDNYGLDEVQNVPTYTQALWLTLEGYTPAAATAVGVKPPTLAGAFDSLAGVTITVGAPQPEIPTQASTPQRILYPCQVTFSKAAARTTAFGGIFPVAGSPPTSLPLTAKFTIQGQTFYAATVIQLLPGDDPYFTNITHITATQENVFYLSQDLRVFTATPAINPTPIVGVGVPGTSSGPPALVPTNGIDNDDAAGYNYIQALLKYLNVNYSNPSGTDPFTLFPDQTNALTGDSSVTPTFPDPVSGTAFINYNFAVARVRLNGTPNKTTPKNVRVFFRLFVSQSSDTDYQVDSTYTSTPGPAGFPAVPTLGTSNNTIPFFATGNYLTTADFGENVDYTFNSVNNQPIAIGTSGGVWAYYGCFLNVYNPTNTLNTNNGPRSVLSLLTGTHNCLVAQIAYDDAPIVNSNGTTKSPENSDKLAQRNLQVTLSDNPGPPATHRVPQTFDLRPSPAIATSPGNLLDYPDELMIDWGNTPEGSIASIYWPQVNATHVLSLAKQIYSTHQLSAADPNTVQCTVRKGFTYVPIPPGAGENFAGLFTVDLPPAVVTGQVFTIVVRRLATRRAGDAPRPPAIAVAALPAAAASPSEKVMRNWRYVVGSFAVRIPVTTGKEMLPIEENTLAIMKWRLRQMLPTNRWYPVLLRYIGYVSGRIDGLGGNSNSIPPSPRGAPSHPTHPTHIGKRHEFTGKVNGVVYDRFGDFEGFMLLTEAGHERAFRSRESEIEALVRFAWQNRVVITVLTESHDPSCPVSIVLRRIHKNHK
jgi:hypothetical protein